MVVNPFRLIRAGCTSLVYTPSGLFCYMLGSECARTWKRVVPGVVTRDGVSSHGLERDVDSRVRPDARLLVFREVAAFPKPYL